MTTIVAIQGEGWAVVGADSRISDDGRIYSMAKGCGKIVRNDDYLFGAAGDLRAINILEHVFNPPDASGYEGKDLDAFITTDFVPALRKCFEDQGYAERSSYERESPKEATAEQGSVILVVVNGIVYEVGEDYSWIKDANGFYGMGTGGDYAIGAVHAMAPTKAKLTIEVAKQITKDALTIGARLDSSSGGPFNIVVQEA